MRLAPQKAARKQLGYVVDLHRAVAEAARAGLHFDERLEPKHAARAVADHLDGCATPRSFLSYGPRDRIGAERACCGLPRHIDFDAHRAPTALAVDRSAAVSPESAATISSKRSAVTRLYSCRSINSEGPIAQLPRQ